MLPDRIGKLIARIEAGELITQKDVDLIAQLQALDLAKAGEDFVRDALAGAATSIEELRSA